MTERKCFEACLIELNKVQAPAILLDDFNYLFRKAIQKYFNKRYNTFETTQQLTDDLRVLVRTKKLEKVDTGDRQDLTGPSYKFKLPTDYVHILNCICEFKVTSSLKCSNECQIIRQGANKLDTSKWSSVITNYYMRPSITQPYYYIVNIEDPEPNLQAVDIDPNGNIVEKTKEVGKRYGNATIPTLEIKCGNLNPNQYELSAVYVDYLRAPEYVNIDQSDLDTVEDTTRVIEFPDYVIYEIINEIVQSILENSKDPRIQTFPSVSTSVPPK